MVCLQIKKKLSTARGVAFKEPNKKENVDICRIVLSGKNLVVSLSVIDNFAKKKRSDDDNDFLNRFCWHR